MLLCGRADSQIRLDVLQQLRTCTRSHDGPLNAEVHSGVVTLSGPVADHAARLDILRLARSIHGVVEVVDLLEIQTPPAQHRDDAELAAAAREALRAATGIPAHRIGVDAASGVITLRGAVEHWAQRAGAEHAVEQLPGLRGLTNLIQIHPPPVEADLIRLQITDALRHRPERDAHAVRVDVRDGVVTLSGPVRSWLGREAIRSAAGQTRGVRHVSDQTFVDPHL